MVDGFKTVRYKLIDTENGGRMVGFSAARAWTAVLAAQLEDAAAVVIVADLLDEAHWRATLTPAFSSDILTSSLPARSAR